MHVPLQLLIKTTNDQTQLLVKTTGYLLAVSQEDAGYFIEVTTVLNFFVCSLNIDFVQSDRLPVTEYNFQLKRLAILRLLVKKPATSQNDPLPHRTSCGIKFYSACSGNLDFLQSDRLQMQLTFKMTNYLPERPVIQAKKDRLLHIKVEFCSLNLDLQPSDCPQIPLNST